MKVSSADIGKVCVVRPKHHVIPSTHPNAAVGLLIDEIYGDCKVFFPVTGQTDVVGHYRIIALGPKPDLDAIIATAKKLRRHYRTK